MKKNELLLEVRKAIKFTITLYYGGGLGDLVHRLYDSWYLCRLRSIREYFPNIKIILQLNTTRSQSAARQLFELNPYFNEIIVYPQWCYNRDIYVFGTNLLGDYKNKFGDRQPGVDNELVFQRVINKIHELLSFPHIRAINMDELFQQFDLDITEFEADDPQIYINKEEEEYGKKIKAELCPNGEKAIGIHFFSDNPDKIINPVFAKEVIDHLLEKKYKLVILGMAKESDPLKFSGAKLKDMVYSMLGYKDNPNVKYCCDDTSIRHKTAIIKNCDYMLACDSSLMHIAWLNKIKTISLFREETVSERLRFMRTTGYYWAIADQKPFASLIIYNMEGQFDMMFLDKRLEEFERAKE